MCSDRSCIARAIRLQASSPVTAAAFNSSITAASLSAPVPR
jgi:hypothetical protein